MGEINGRDLCFYLYTYRPCSNYFRSATVKAPSNYEGVFFTRFNLLPSFACRLAIFFAFRATKVKPPPTIDICHK